MNSAVVTLKEPVQWGDAIVKEIVIRKPTYGNCIACGGPPYVPVMTSSGAFEVIDFDRLRQYYDLLVDHPGRYAVINMLSLDDGIAVQEALLGFFRDSPPATSGAPQTSSSSI
jgi:hypothetical protein